MGTVIFLSPHYDDAVLSGGFQIQKMVENQQDVVVVSVFTKDQSERKKENEKALALLGARSFDLNLTDAPERSQKILFSSPLNDPQTLNELTQAFRNLPFAYDNVFAPLGIGWHIDHLLVYEAALKAFPENLFFYEDSPYHFSSAQAELRFSITPSLLNRYREEFFDLHYVKAWLSHWTITELEASFDGLELTQKPYKSFVNSGKNTSRKAEAIKCYQSQWPCLFENEADIQVKINSFPEKFYAQKETLIDLKE
jgi:LmbE family N-acetylglucosaminyl deacetylase